MNEEKITIKAARIIAGFTQKEVGDSINVKKETISSWERGLSEPKISQAYALSALYGRPLDSLIFLPS